MTDAAVQRTYDMMVAPGVRSAIVTRMGQMVLPGIGHVAQEKAPREMIVPLRALLVR